MTTTQSAEQSKEARLALSNRLLKGEATIEEQRTIEHIVFVIGLHFEQPGRWRADVVLDQIVRRYSDLLAHGGER